MRAWTMVLPVSLFALAASVSCSSDPAPQNTSRLCTPADHVFCRCADPNSQGTKRCSDDGQSFSECDCGEPLPDVGEEDWGIPWEEDTNPPDTAPSAIEKCPGKTVAVDPNKDVVVEGDTSSATDDSTGTGACAVGAGKDHVYAIIPTASGKLNIKMTGTGTMDPTLYVREGDCATAPQLRCGETTGAAGTEQFDVNVLTGKTYYVFADGKAGSEGAYTITMRLTPGTFCGDGTVDFPEGCDDGNKIAGDGCENDCRPTGDIPASDSCPGVEAHVWPGTPLTFSGSTTGANLSYESDSAASCGPFGSNAADRVYALRPHKTGTMTVEVTGAYNTGIYVRRSPCATGTQIACANAVGTGSPATTPQTEKVEFSVSNGQTYYLIVDGALTYRGTFTVKASLL